MPRDRAHVFAVRVDFGNGVEASDEMAFGGVHGSEITSELTAVPVVMTDDTERPPIEKLHGQFSVDGRPVRVLGIDAARVRSSSCGTEVSTIRPRRGPMPPDDGWLRGGGMFGALNPGDRIRFLSPYAPISDRKRSPIRTVSTLSVVFSARHTVAHSPTQATTKRKGGIGPRPMRLQSRVWRPCGGIIPAQWFSCSGARSKTTAHTHRVRFVASSATSMCPLFVWRIGQDEHPNWPEAVSVGVLPEADGCRGTGADVSRIATNRLDRGTPSAAERSGSRCRRRCPDLLAASRTFIQLGSNRKVSRLRADDLPTPPAGVPTFTGEIEVIVVNVEAFVRDRKGRPITDLELEDFPACG